AAHICCTRCAVRPDPSNTTDFLLFDFLGTETQREQGSVGIPQEPSDALPEHDTAAIGVAPISAPGKFLNELFRVSIVGELAWRAVVVTWKLECLPKFPKHHACGGVFPAEKNVAEFLAGR